MNFYKHHIGDYAAATAHLSFMEDAAFSRLLRIYYRDERPLPVSVAAVQRLIGARTDEEKATTETMLLEFFTLRDDGWHNKRCDEEVAKACAQAETNRRIAEERELKKRGTNGTRNDNEPCNDSCNDSSTVNVGEREPSQTPDSRLQKEKNQKTLAQRTAARFDEFWDAYPAKRGKAEALKKWKSRSLDQIADQIIADVQARKVGDRRWLDGFPPDGSTYVNGSRWEDAIEQPKLNGKDGKPVQGYIPMPGER